MSNKVLGIASGIISAGSAIYGAIRQRKAAKEQAERQKELQEHAKEQQLDLWRKTNYSEQRRQMEKAGLNAGLMYGMGGAAGGEIGAGGAGNAGQEQVYDLNSAINNAKMTQANIELAKSQAEKNKAEAEKIKGTDTTESQSRTELNKIKAEFERINTEIHGRTKEEQVNIIRDSADKMLAEAVQEQHNQIISESTYKDRIQQIKAEAIGATIQNELSQSKIEVNKAEIERISNDIMQKWEQIDVSKEGIRASIQNMEQLTETMLWQAGINATGNLVGDVVKIATRQVPSGKQVTTKTNYDKKGRSTTKSETTTYQ